VPKHVFYYVGKKGNNIMDKENMVVVRKGCSAELLAKADNKLLLHD